MIRGIIFDMDGTLVDTIPFLSGMWEEISRQVGMPISREKVRGKLDGRGIDALIRSLFPGMPGKIRKEIWRIASERYDVTEMLLLPDVRRTLEALRKRGMRMAVASGSPTRQVRLRLREGGIAGYFTHAIGVDQVSHMKPHPECFTKGARSLGLEPQECIGVGDSVLDMMAARAAGCVTVAVLTGSHRRQDFETVGPDFIINSLGELLDLVG